uniref:Vegetative incompatibility protein HET-E-1 n=1 Tax=Anthurium amnicola TaxID=1678845 RepID=A0A1D1XEV9_9ARAE
MPRRPSTSSWSPLLLHSAACCSPAADPLLPSPSLNDDPTAAGTHRDHPSRSAAATLRSDLSIPSLRSLQVSSSPSSPPSSSSSAARHHLISSLASHPRRSASTSLTVSPTGELLYSASHSGIAVYDLASLRLLEAFRSVAAGAVKSLAFSSDGRVFTAHQDAKIRAWTTPPPPAAVEEPSTSDQRAGRHRLVASLPTMGDRLLRIAIPSNYVAVRRHRKRLWIEHADAVAGLAARGGLLYSVSWDKTLKVWRAADLRCLQSLPAHDDAVNAVAVGPDFTVYTGSADSRIRVWQQQPPDLDSRSHRRRYALVATLEKHRSAVNALALSADGGVLCSGACDRSILVWEKGETAGQMTAAGAIRGHRQAIMCLAYAEDLLVSGSTDRTVRVWRRTPGGEYCCLAVMEGHAGGVRSVAARRIAAPESAAEEYRVCSGSSDGEVRVWKVWVSSADRRGDEGEIARESRDSSKNRRMREREATKLMSYLNNFHIQFYHIIIIEIMDRLFQKSP